VEAKMLVDRDVEIAMRDGVRVKVERARSHKMQQTHDTDLYPAAHRGFDEVASGAELVR
jgi:hypothetical protein